MAVSALNSLDVT